MQIHVGDYVHAPKDKLPVYGKVLSVSRGKVKVQFCIPNRPTVCEKCHSSLGLSVNMGTGEVECMNTGCGYGHGFKTETRTYVTADLENISTKRKEEGAKKLRAEVGKLLAQATKNGLVTARQVERVQKALA